MPNRYVQQRGVMNQLLVHAEYNGAPLRDFGFFDKRDGLGLAAEVVNYGEYPPANGVKTREPATLRRPYSESSPEQEAWCEAHIDTAISLIVHYKGDDGLPAGIARTFTGILNGVTPPEGDQTASERAEFSVICAVDINAS